MRRLHGFAAAVMVALLVACSDATGPAPLEFEVIDAPLTDSTVAVQTSPGVLMVTGRFVATCAPYALDGELEQEGSALRLRVVGRFVDGCPLDVMEELAYRATVRDLASGTYQLQVSYRRPEMTADSTVFDRTVQVP